MDPKLANARVSASAAAAVVRPRLVKDASVASPAEVCNIRTTNKSDFYGIKK